jgi:FMN phosphatase YigB (HAD superfamily)
VSIFPKTGGINDFFPEDYPYSFNQFDYDDLTKKISSLSNQKQINIFSKKNKDYIQKLLERNYLLKKFQEIIDE